MIKVNGKEIKFTKFPNNETLVDTEVLNNLKDSEEPVRVEFKWFNDADLLHLYFVLKHLYDLINSYIELYIYYMPYSRMDRGQNGGCFTLQYVKELLESCVKFDDKIYGKYESKMD